jgi:DNA-binding winged helix-turn-helix (wHTH) protein
VIARFGPFTLNVASRELSHGDERRHLSTKAFDLLTHLVARRPAVVDKAELRQHLWPETHVVDASLANLITEVRRALDDNPAEPAWVRTVHGVGYAFAGQVVEAGEGAAGGTQAGTSAGTTGAGPGVADAAATGTVCWLSWKRREFTLGAGAHTIGRDPSSAVWVDAPGVSRRHACLTVRTGDGGARATIEDLDSTNGTCVRGRRISSPEAVHDGDEIRLGTVRLTFRVWRGAEAPTRRVRGGRRNSVGRTFHD